MSLKRRRECAAENRIFLGKRLLPNYRMGSADRLAVQPCEIQQIFANPAVFEINHAPPLAAPRSTPAAYDPDGGISIAKQPPRLAEVGDGGDMRPGFLHYPVRLPSGSPDSGPPQPPRALASQPRG